MQERSPLEDRELTSYKVRANWRMRAEKQGIDPYTIGHLMKFAHRHVYEIDRVDTALRNTTEHPYLSKLQSYTRAFFNGVIHKPFNSCIDEKSPIDYSRGREMIEHILFSEKDRLPEKQWKDLSEGIHILYSQNQ